MPPATTKGFAQYFSPAHIATELTDKRVSVKPLAISIPISQALLKLEGPGYRILRADNTPMVGLRTSCRKEVGRHGPAKTIVIRGGRAVLAYART